MTPYMDSCPQGGRVAGDGRPLPVLHAGTPQASGSRHKGMLGKARSQSPVQAPARAQEADAGDKKDPLAL